MKDVTRHYPALTPRERVAAIQSAWQRGDEADAQRLISTAPVKAFDMPEHLWAGEQLKLAQLAVLVDLLTRACEITEGLFILDRTRAERPALENALCVLAARMVAAFDGYTLLCARLGFEAPGAIGELPGWRIVADVTERARALAYSPAELAEQGRADTEPTPERWADAWLKTIEHLTS